MRHWTPASLGFGAHAPKLLFARSLTRALAHGLWQTAAGRRPPRGEERPEEWPPSFRVVSSRKSEARLSLQGECVDVTDNGGGLSSQPIKHRVTRTARHSHRRPRKPLGLGGWLGRQPQLCRLRGSGRVERPLAGNLDSDPGPLSDAGRGGRSRGPGPCRAAAHLLLWAARSGSWRHHCVPRGGCEAAGSLCPPPPVPHPPEQTGKPAWAGDPACDLRPLSPPAERVECSPAHARSATAGVRRTLAGATPRLAARPGPAAAPERGCPSRLLCRPMRRCLRTVHRASPRPRPPPSSRAGTPATGRCGRASVEAARPGQGPRQRCLIRAGRESRWLLSDRRPVSSAWRCPGHHVAGLPWQLEGGVPCPVRWTSLPWESVCLRSWPGP